MRYRLVANTKLLIEKQLLNDRSRSSKGGAVLCPTRPPVIEAQPPPQIQQYIFDIILANAIGQSFSLL